MIKRNILYPIRNVILRDRPLVVNASGLSYVLAPEGAIPLEMWSGRYFERQELEFVLSVLEPGMTFVDVGANVGMFSIAAAKKVQEGRVLAFEPCGWTYERLIKNQGLNGVTNLQTIRTALGERTGEAILHVNVPGKDGLNTIGRPTHGDSEVVDAEKVPVVTLDEALQQCGIFRVDVMKMDVEGAELLVLLGARRLLSSPNAPLILYEGSFLSKGFDYHPVEEMWLLQKCGYSLFLLDSNSGRISIPPNGKAYDASVIAVKPSHPAYGRIKERAS
jgi:FkbM family methyltransferase